MPVTPTEGSRTPSLTDDVTVGPVTLHGRLAIPPMACGRASRSGEVTEELLARDRRLLQGGAPGVLSLVTLEHH
jgi:2,4-dienoyl-CoA reductase-like NADH-dependent reductase (Old Yellow Enzyme family)